MAWQVLKVDQLPLGCRILRHGCSGKDVIELQKMMAQAGFYFGTIDGYYGVLTESAVALVERTFRLQVDGIAGKQVIQMLHGLSQKMGRTVYTVKPHENLEQISQRYGVAPKAWDTVSGEGNPLKKIFPGMRLILYEKAVLYWNESMKAEGMTVTGRLSQGGRVTRQGGLEIAKEIDSDHFLVISAEPDIWEEVVTSRAKRTRFLSELRLLRFHKIGLDFRMMKPKLSGYWKNLLKTAAAQKPFARMFFVIAPIILAPGDPWRSYGLLQWIGSCKGIDWLMVEAQFSEEETPFEEQMKKYYKDLAELNHTTMQKVIPVFSSEAWQAVQRKKVSYKEARTLRALNYRTAGYLPEIRLTRVGYLHDGKEQCLYYRDHQGWSDLLEYIKKYHFSGIVLRDPEMPGIALPDLFAGAFKILTDRKFMELTKG